MRRTASLCLVMSLSLASIPVAFAAEPAAQADPIANATALYDQGLAQFQVAEYVPALVLWNQAYSSLTPTPATRAIRATLAGNIVLAHQRAYEVTRNLEHLVEGRRLIDNRKAELAHLYGQDADAIAESAQLDARRDELGQAFEAGLTRGEVATPLPTGAGLLYNAPQVAPPGPAPVVAPPPVVPTQASIDAIIEADPEFGPQFQQGKALTGGGAGMIVVGGVAVITALALAGTGALLNDSAQLSGVGTGIEGNGYYKGALIAGSVGGVILIGGAVMVGFGGSAKNQARNGYRARQAGVTAVAPVFLHGGAGLGLGGRF